MPVEPLVVATSLKEGLIVPVRKQKQFKDVRLSRKLFPSVKTFRYWSTSVQLWTFTWVRSFKRWTFLMFFLTRFHLAALVILTLHQKLNW